MAHKTGSGSSKNGRDSISKRLGIKQFLFFFFLLFIILQKTNYILSNFIYFISDTLPIEIELSKKEFFFKKNNEFNYVVFIKNLFIKNNSLYSLYKNYIYSLYFFHKKIIEKYKSFFRIIKLRNLIFNNYPYNIYNNKFLFNFEYVKSIILILLYIHIKKNRFYKAIKFTIAIPLIIFKLILCVLNFKNSNKFEDIDIFFETHKTNELINNYKNINLIYILFFMKNIKILINLIYFYVFIYFFLYKNN